MSNNLDSLESEIKASKAIEPYEKVGKYSLLFINSYDDPSEIMTEVLKVQKCFLRRLLGSTVLFFIALRY